MALDDNCMVTGGLDIISVDRLIEENRTILIEQQLAFKKEREKYERIIVTQKEKIHGHRRRFNQIEKLLNRSCMENRRMKKKCSWLRRLHMQMERETAALHQDRITSQSNPITGNLNEEGHRQFEVRSTDTIERLLYYCEHCGVQFSRQNDLQSHKKTHSMKYVCTHCGVKFKHKIPLDKHMRTCSRKRRRHI